MKKPSDNTAVRVTMGDVARRSGVHASTVSAVLAGKTKERRISSDIAARVRRAAEELDFTPNLVSRSLRAGATQTLSFFNGYRYRGRGDLYMDALTTALEQEAGERNYDIYIYCNFRRSTEETYSYLNGGRSDGLIFFAPQNDDPLLPLLQKSRMPTVMLCGTGVVPLPCVTADQVDGMRQIAARLLALGHRKVAVITRAPDDVNSGDALLRTAEIRHYLQAGGAIVSEHVTPQHYEPFLQSLMVGPDAPTAIFCWHDYVGYRVLEACAALNLSVPDQLSVVGYDGLHWPSTSPHLLASVAVPLEAMARGAVALLDDLIAGRPHSNEPYRVSFQEGTTLAPPRGGR